MGILKPKVTVNIIPAYQKEQNEAQKVLFIGQMTAAGTATSGQLYESIGNANEQDTLFGKKSMLARMIRAAKKINKVTRFDAIPLDDDGAAVAATGTVAFSGTAGADGTYYVTVGSEKNNKYTIAVLKDDLATDIGDALVAAITADTTSSVTAANVTGTVTLTTVNKGLAENNITLKLTGSVASVTPTITAMTGGTTDPSVTNLFDPVENIRYQTIVWPEYILADVITFLDNRFNSENRVLDGVAISSSSHTFADLKTIGNANPSKSLCFQGNELINDSLYKGSALLEFDHVISSIFAAVRSLRLTPDAEISQYVISYNGALDFTGGTALASKPYFNTPFEDLPLKLSDKQFTDEERDELKDAGVFVIGNNEPNTQVICDEVVTTYKTDPAGNPDLTFKYLNYVDTEVSIREYFYNNLRERFAQSRLTEGSVVPGRDMANAAIISDYLNQLYNDLSGADFVLVPAGEDSRKFFKDNKTVTLDLALGKATVTMQVPIVVQLREIIVNMQISFSINS